LIEAHIEQHIDYHAINRRNLALGQEKERQVKDKMDYLLEQFGRVADNKKMDGSEQASAMNRLLDNIEKTAMDTFDELGQEFIKRAHHVAKTYNLPAITERLEKFADDLGYSSPAIR